MPLRLNVGVSKKLGLPAYSSIGASCQLEIELESGLLRDREGFRDQVRTAFLAAQQAVNDELARLQDPAPASTPAPIRLDPEPSRRDQAENGHHEAVSPSRTPFREESPRALSSRTARPATPNQVRAIAAIARHQRRSLDEALGELGVTRPEELTIAQASRLIDRLRTTEPAR